MQTAKTHHTALFGLFGLAALAAWPAQASLLAHSEVHLSNIQITPQAGSLSWTYSPGLNIASASLFDDPSGPAQAYDDDPGATGQASASVTSPPAAYGSASAFASSNQGKIDVVSDVSYSGNAITPITNSAYGEIYNVFQINGANPIQVNFSLDWSALLTGQSAMNAYAFSYTLQILVSDGINQYSRESVDILPVKGDVSSNPGGTLTFAELLQPNTSYSVDIIGRLDLGQYVPEPSTLSLFLGAALFSGKISRHRRKLPKTS